MSNELRLTRKYLRELNLNPFHEARNVGKADVARLPWPPDSTRWVVVKDLSRRPLWYRVLWGRATLKREWKALLALQGIDGIPAPVARLDADAFAMEWHPGKPASQWDRKTIPADALVRASQILAQAHARGITHGDLHAHNILVSEDGEVTLVDWATASRFGPNPRGPKLIPFREWQRLDERSLAKLKVRHVPHLVTPRDREMLTQGSPLSRLVRDIGFYFRRLLGLPTGLSPTEASARLARRLERQAQRVRAHEQQARERELAQLQINSSPQSPTKEERL